jgi:hypothetical protein
MSDLASLSSSHTSYFLEFAPSTSKNKERGVRSMTMRATTEKKKSLRRRNDNDTTSRREEYGGGGESEDFSVMTPNGDREMCGSSHDSLGTSSKLNKSTDGPEPIAKKETTAVKGLKMLVLVVLVLAMVTITVGVYLFTTNAEQNEFEDSLSDYTVKIVGSLGENIDLTLGAVDAFVVSIVSFAKATNQTWPFVTIPDFAVRGAKIRSLSSATVLNLYQYVTHKDRAAWEAYTAIHGPVWVNQSIGVQERDENYKGPIIWDYENWNVIHGNEAYDAYDEGSTVVQAAAVAGKQAEPGIILCSLVLFKNVVDC